MREIGKTKVASVLVALSCCALAALSFQMHLARAEDRETFPSVEKSAVAIEETGSLTRPPGGSDHATSAGAAPLTCRLENVGLAPGFHKNRS